MKEIVEKYKCTACTACESICPQSAIKMETDKNGFKYYYIDNKKCINCNLCQKVCPVLNKKHEVKRDIIVYSCYNKNNGERINSSSGGIFILLANEIIKKGGVVFRCFFQ